MSDATDARVRVMSAVVDLVGRRLARRAGVGIAVGILLGAGFGLSLAAFNTARRTSSAYHRILVRADAPDAAIAHSLSVAEADALFGDLDGVVAQRQYTGYVGQFDGIDAGMVTSFLVPEQQRFPIERPTLREGRLPAPDRAREVVLNSYFADRAGIELGDRLDMTLISPDQSRTVTEPVEVVGIGTFAREAVVDETAGSGVVVLSPAFAPLHRDLAAYSSMNVDLAPGVDARRDLAPQVTELGFSLQEARASETHAVREAMRPMIVILLGLGVLAFVASAIVAGQAIQREQERWRHDDEILRQLGMVRTQLVLASVVPAALLGALATVLALVVMFFASPLAPVGPLHALDPAQGFAVDLTVALLGALAIVATVVGIAGGLALRRRAEATTVASPPRSVAAVGQRPAAAAGMALAFGGNRSRARRTVAFATVAVLLAAGVVTLVASAVALADSPARYGFDWDVLALSAYGDQTDAGLQAVFAEDPDVAAATGFTAAPLLVDGRAVPGLAARAVKGQLGPTILRGRSVRGDDEIVVGGDTLDQLGVELGDRVAVQVAGADGARARPLALRVVGVATFAPVVQIGTDQPRLGTGALVRRDTFDRLSDTTDNNPEWTAARLAPGVTPAAMIARNPEGVPDALGMPTRWFTDAKPAELRQLESVRSLLYLAIALSAVLALGLIAHALLAQTRDHRFDLAVLTAIGFTRRQRGEAAAWQALPLAALVTVVGAPLGIVIGRFVYGVFARSLAVDDRATIPPALVVILVVGALVASGLGALAAAGVARRTHTAVELRSE
ncbi:MAG TPA: FtsX-like permease family protein [Acidimicrobiia bacterium]|nr:FtsX-like permease family protein [Acidimicrobiia bacterium]